MSSPRTRTTLIAVLGAAVATVLVVNQRRSGFDPTSHSVATSEIRRLQQLDATVNLLVLESRFGLRHSYDQLVDVMRHLSAGVDQLHVHLHDLGPEFVAEVASLRDHVATKEVLVEDFKSNGAQLRNALRYLPAAVGGALREGVTDEVLELTEGTLQFALNTESRHAEELDRVLSALPRSTGSSVTTEGASPRFIEHARRLLEAQARADVTVSELLALPLQSTLSQIERKSGLASAALARRTKRDRLVLWCVSLGLFGYAIATFLRLRAATGALHAANRSLESRIRARTMELRENNEELQNEVDVRRRTEEELTRANQELDEFTRVASHDLQEPLRKLVSFSEMLKVDLGTDLPERAAEDLHYVQDAARRMQRLVQDLLALSRAGNREITLEPVDLERCLDDALSALDLRIVETGATIEHDELPHVLGDRTLLTQLLQNLVGNALKFVREDVVPQVRILAAVRGDRLEIRCTDNGIGIEQKHQERIFAPFKRLHGRGDYEGTGIGLAICHKTVTRHGGELSVDSEVDKGATFTFTLPACPPGAANESTESISSRHRIAG